MSSTDQGLAVLAFGIFILGVIIVLVYRRK
jgi:hypothetical protein